MGQHMLGIHSYTLTEWILIPNVLVPYLFRDQLRNYWGHQYAGKSMFTLFCQRNNRISLCVFPVPMWNQGNTWESQHVLIRSVISCGNMKSTDNERVLILSIALASLGIMRCGNKGRLLNITATRINVGRSHNTDYKYAHVLLLFCVTLMTTYA